uniref:Predicted protein n=1 Tax=Hordeum vulgare subsp. vulgare TaxID=112509 RepID=F2EJX1_HORVV|nr:predicted protein [Hordeum vulgare subsp. vulgare]
MSPCYVSDVGGAGACVLLILLLSSSKTFMLSASKPPANCAMTNVIVYLMNTEGKSDALEKQELPVGLFVRALQRVELRRDPLHVLPCQLN